MVVSVTGIVINVIMAIIILIMVAFGVSFSNALQTCETQQSPFCYTIHCPCDNTSQPGGAPCFGYAKRPAENPGQWYCSNAPLSVVDNNGNLV